MSNRSFDYGDGFFESIRRKDGQWLFLNEHLLRAKKSAKVLGMEWSASWDLAWLESVCNFQNKSNIADLIVRITFYRSQGGTYSPELNTCKFRTVSRTINADEDGLFVGKEGSELIQSLSLLQKEFKVGLYTQNYKSISDWSFVKTTSALFYVQASMDAQKRELDDLIILNNQGLVCELLFSNLLILNKGQLYCLGKSSGAIEGTFLSALQEKIEVKEIRLSLEQLKKIDYLFRCNSVRGIQRIELSK